MMIHTPLATTIRPCQTTASSARYARTVEGCIGIRSPARDSEILDRSFPFPFLLWRQVNTMTYSALFSVLDRSEKLYLALQLYREMKDANVAVDSIAYR